MNEAIELLARRAEDDPFFLGSLLVLFARSETMDDATLADFLGCPVETVPALKLCGTPREETAGFRADMERVAQHFGLSLDRLVEGVRRGQALQRLRTASHASRGLLAAARDEDEEPPS